MKTFLKSNFFWTKVLPTAFYCVLLAGGLYPFSKAGTGSVIVCILLISILLTNLFLKKSWINLIFGVIPAMFFFYLIFAVISEYSEFPSGASYEALRLLIVGLALCFSVIGMGILMCIPFKRENIETYVSSVV